MSSRGRSLLLPSLLLAACAALCVGCAAREEPPRMKIVKETQHANGLVVGVPEGFEARRTEYGFGVEASGSANREVRYPAVAYVTHFKGDDAPDESSFQTKSIGGREVRYSVTKSAGGSGGETYLLKVLERVPGGHLRYSQLTQSEMGEPDFALCWALVGSTKYRPKNN